MVSYWEMILLKQEKHGYRGESVRHAARGMFIVLTQKAFTLTDDDN